MTPSRDDNVTMSACPVCDTLFTPVGRRRFCSHACRQTAYRRRQPTPISEPTPTGAARRDTTVYECTECGQRYHAHQWCADCNRPCRRVGTGGSCPSCGDPVTIDDLIRQ